MTIFGLNSPEIFVLIAITLAILGTKRIERGLDLLSRLLKFLLNNQSSFDDLGKKKEDQSEEIEETKEKEAIKEKEEIKEKEAIKEKEEIKEKEDQSDERLKIANEDNKEKKSAKTKNPKGIVIDKTSKKLKTKNTNRKVKDKTVTNSKIINVQDDRLEK